MFRLNILLIIQQLLIFNNHLLNFTTAEISEDMLSYYENLIKQEQIKANQFDLPTSAREYEGDIKNGAKFDGMYDYIIAGCGSAGSALAGQLSEDPHLNVLVLEAGGFETDFSNIPAMNGYLVMSPLNWNYKTISQTHGCYGMKDRQCQVVRGKGVGGSSLLNGLVYARGSRADYDEWGRESKGWSYKDVLPFFKEVEQARFQDAEIDYHGFNGTLRVEHANYTTIYLETFLKASEELGMKIVDYNGANAFGASISQINTKRGRRLTSAQAFIRKRKNLHLSDHSYVIKLLITAKKRVNGVYFMRNRTQYLAKAKREVIVSAGTIGSPHILLLSGIGPANHLQEKQIPIVADVPVGENFRDHIANIGVLIKTNISINPLSVKEQIEQYLKGYGPLTLPDDNAGLGFYKLNSNSKAPYMELVMKHPVSSVSNLDKTLRLSKDTAEYLETHMSNLKTMQLVIVLLRPKSVGNIRLKSNNPFDYPLIDPRLLQHKEDVFRLYEGIKIVKRYLKTESFKRLNATIDPLLLPACKHYEYDSESYWYCTIRQLSFGGYHAVGTCKMGSSPKTSVVNEKLQVHGVEGLRIADISVMPFTISGHTNSMAVMIGTRCANFLKNSLYVDKSNK